MLSGEDGPCATVCVHSAAAGHIISHIFFFFGKRKGSRNLSQQDFSGFCSQDSRVNQKKREIRIAETERRTNTASPE
jgi:hypothetical protein